MSGPPRTPTPILEARGSWLAKERAQTEPKPRSGSPACPKWLSKQARTIFRATCRELEAMRTLAKSDWAVIARYSDMTIRFLAAVEFLDKYGSTYPLKDAEGKLRCMQQFPQVAIYHKLATCLLKIEQELGLTPASRSRIQVAGRQDAPGDTKARFFKVTG